MPYYEVTTKSRSTLHPRAAAKLGFSVAVPGQVHELDADVAAPFLPRTETVDGPPKRDTKTGEMRPTKRKLEHAGLLKKSSKKKYEAQAEADELDESDEADADEAE